MGELHGTVALEMFEEIGELDMLLVPCGGGGLLSGCAVAAKGASGNCRTNGIEPELADGTRTPSLGKIVFPLVLE
ncbi:pyridoxal-phosphate dependent enzyme [uncultured Desulfosarcina sp.]|uniref:pyridoxal-phosphate dependent enzyme n=1 Tax=uncultured Desulfosarcina sp. TaxID=218289 RepID=UPI0029C79F9B|nr:pyridoxal-phosphate dependent enzyme [uncultured Desulfosarcina sp.]